MKTNQNEFLSAVLDDEAGEFERRRLLDELCEGTELGQTLNRYSLVGETMRSQQRTISDSSSFLAGIQDQLEDEPEYNEVLVPAAVNDVVQGGSQNDGNSQLPGSITTQQPWHRQNAGRYAVAASVAVAALAGVLLMQNTGVAPDESEVMAEAPAPVIQPVAVADIQPATQDIVQVASSQPVPSSNRRMMLANANLDQRTADTLKQYVTLHMQYRSSNGIAPSIQAVSYAQ